MQYTHKRTIQKVAVLGSGVMGSRIACHFANVGVEVLLLDIVPRELNAKEEAKGLSLEHPAVRNRIVNDSLKAAVKGKPAALYHADSASLISTGNFDDDIEKIADCDWVMEVVVERLDIKQKVFAQVDEHRKKGALVTSNTSGIPIHMMAEGRSDDFKANFCGTHFFNPPRYLRLLEIIPGPDTHADVVDFLMDYGDRFLGKKTVKCKDTPAFIANRVGVYAMSRVLQLTEELGLTIEEVDGLTGPATGKPKTGTFRLSDLVGLDTTAHVMRGVMQNCPHDEAKAAFEAPAFVHKMVENKWLGDKTRQGFYKKTKAEDGSRLILSLDLNTLEYREKQRPNIPSLKQSRELETLQERLAHFWKAEDKGGEFFRRSSSALFAYAANRIPEIADNLYQIDDAVCAGFAWDKGPFELWDMIGIEKGLAAFEQDGLKIADWVQEMLEAGNSNFYKVEDGLKHYYDIASKSYKPLPGAEKLIFLDNIRPNRTVWTNGDASVIDLGDGVVNVEFHSKMNSLGVGCLQAVHEGIEYAETHGYNGVVIANEGVNFSVGANLMLIAMMAMEQEWDELSMAVHQFQQTSMRIRTSGVPVVVAPHAMCLGGGCEFTMHADKVVASAESYIGLVEVGVGLIPGGGGTKEFALRASDIFEQKGSIDVTVLQEFLMNIATAKVATSAAEARAMNILRSTDEIVLNNDRRIKQAKDAVLEIAAAGYTPPAVRKNIRVLGRNALASFYAGISGLQYGEYASAHDALIARKVAWVLCGGELSGDDNRVSEQYLLDIEREAFLSLLGEMKTLERIQHMLQKGKPLRN
ncbi:MAG: 3-hydroxyacyl-CoA dehydrogenase NAD-binding domain-containing protein, partial [Bacteroidia bacterium]